MRIEENIGQWIAGSICVWLVVNFIVWVLRGIRGLFVRAQPPLNQWDIVHAVLKQPVPRPDGTWEQAELTWKTCAPPIAANSLEVHDRQAPGHDEKTCKHCKPAGGYSGVSYRAN